MLPELGATAVDEAVLREHLARLERGLDDDPAAVIGSSKELIESVCKLALQRLEIEHDEKADVPVLVRSTLKALKLHRDSVAPTAPAAEAVNESWVLLCQWLSGWPSYGMSWGLGMAVELRSPSLPDTGTLRQGPQLLSLACC